MPSTWRVHVIAERLKQAGIDAFVRESDVFALEGLERAAASDAMIARGAEPPMVLVEGALACHGDIDLDAIEKTAEESAS